MSTKAPTFDRLLALFIKATSNSQRLARQCAEMAIGRFAENGDLSYCQRFLDAMPKNFLRRAAFLKWLGAYSPIAMNEDGKLCKDTSETAVPFNLDAARAKPFWDFAPDQEQVFFGENDVVVQLNRVIKRFENSKKYKPENDTAIAKLAKAKELISTLGVAKAA